MNHKPKKLRATGDKIIVQLPLKIQYQINIFDREVTDFLERYLLNESAIRLGRYEQDGTLWKQDEDPTGKKMGVHLFSFRENRVLNFETLLLNANAWDFNFFSIIGGKYC